MLAWQRYHHIPHIHIPDTRSHAHITDTRSHVCYITQTNSIICLHNRHTITWHQMASWMTDAIIRHHMCHRLRSYGAYVTWAPPLQPIWQGGGCIGCGGGGFIMCCMSPCVCACSVEGQQSRMRRSMHIQMWCWSSLRWAPMWTTCRRHRKQHIYAWGEGLISKWNDTMVPCRKASSITFVYMLGGGGCTYICD